MSVGVSVIRSAPSDSVSCVRVRAPTNGTMAGTLREHPRNRQLRGCRMLLRRQLSKRADETLVLLEVLAREAWQTGPEVAWGVRLLEAGIRQGLERRRVRLDSRITRLRYPSCSSLETTHGVG